MRTPESKGHANVNGVELYYEVHGDGRPLIMLHGGVTPSEMFGAPLVEMAKAHKVVALHARGHGLSKDSSRPWSHEVFADDVAALMGHLGIEKASVMGYSSGAVVALQTAIRHPRLVDNLIAISTAFRSDGYYPEVLEVFAQMPAAAPMIAAEVSRTPLASLYPSVNWETMFRKTGELANRSYDWSASVSRSRRRRCSCLRMPTASALNTSRSSTNCWAADNATPAFDGSLRSPNRLAVIPNTTHRTILGCAAVTQFASSFLKSQ